MGFPQDPLCSGSIKVLTALCAKNRRENWNTKNATFYGITILQRYILAEELKQQSMLMIHVLNLLK